MTGFRRLSTRFLMTTAVLGWTASAAFAQSTPGGIAEPDVILDDNGVDLLTGKYYALAAEARSQGLAYQAKWFGAYDVSLLNSRVIVSGIDVFVSIAGKTVKFTKVGSVYVPEDNKGDTLERFGANNGFIYRTKAGDAAFFDDDPTNLAGNAPGTTSARLSTLGFADPTRKQINFMYKTVSSGGLVYRRISMIMEKYFGAGEGYNAIKPAYVSNLATHPDFKKLASIHAFYQGPYATQQACTHLEDSCPSLTAREQLMISSTVSGGTETIAMTDKGGGVTTVTKSAHGVTAIRNPGDAADGVTIAYNGSGEVSTLTSYGRSFTYTFGTSGANRTATVTAAGGGSKYYVIDPARRVLLSRRNEELETQSFAYDGEDRVTQITYPEGNAVTFTYDGRANPTQTSRVAKPGSGDATTSITMGFPTGCTNATPNCNEAIWSQDAKGIQTDYVNGRIQDEYYIDEIRYPAATVGGDRLVVWNKYSNIYGRIQDGSGFEEPTGVVDTELTHLVRLNAPLGNFSALTGLWETYFSFDDNFGEHEILPLNTVDMGPNGSGGTLYRYGRGRQYDGLGRLDREQDSSAGYGLYNRFYDSKNRLIGIIGPDHDGAGAMSFAATRISYNNRGLVDKIEAGTATAQTQAALNTMTVLRAVEHIYDANRRLEKSQIRAGGNIIGVTQYSYDAQGRVECAAQRMNSAIFASLPASACTLGTAGSFGPDRISKRHYDAAGRVLRIEHGFGTAEVEDDVTYSYNDNGTVATLTDAKGNRTTYEYDGHDRLKKTIFPHKVNVGTSDPADYEEYWYDANDNVTQRRLRDGQSIHFTHDRLNRVTLVDLPGSESDISYTYDVEGRLKTATRGTTTNSLSYDAFGRLTSEGGNIGAMQFQYDGMNRVTRMTWPDGFYVTYEYYGAGPVKVIKENGSAAIASYGYDSFGRQASVTYGNGAAQNYGFDSAARLSSIGHDLSGTANDMTIGLTYNPAGQIATRTGSNDAFAWTGHYNVDRSYTANGLNQFATAGAIAFGYDARGNLTTSGASSYGYSSENLMISGPGGATLGYDGRGKLFETAKAGATTRFLYAGSALVGEYSGSNVLQRRYIHGPRADNPLLWYEGTGTTDKRYLLTDERGSITTLSNGSAALFGINRYDEYGIPGAANVGRFGYTGQTWLPEVGLNYYKARIYSPTLGRFMQTDPIGYGDGTNIYNYVRSDPVNGTDPTGQMVDPNDIVVTASRDNDIVVTGSRPGRGSEPQNCLAFGGGCAPTGRDLADEYAYAYAERQAKLSAPPAAKPANACPTPPANRPVGTTAVYEAAFWDPTGMIIAFDVRQIAHAATRERYGQSGTDDESDAYRHFYGSVALTNLIGGRRAQGILNANEVTNGKEQAAVDMDTYNNWVGVAMAQDPRFDGWSTADMADYALKNGCLRLKP